MRGTTNVPSCYVLLRQNDDTVFFLMRQNTGFMDGFYCLPAGHVEPMESFREAACREVLEEAGVRVSPDDLRHVHTLHRRAKEGDHVRVDVFFETRVWQGEAHNAEPEKHTRAVWLSIDKLPGNVMDYTAFVLENIRAGEAYSEIGWAA